VKRAPLARRTPLRASPETAKAWHRRTAKPLSHARTRTREEGGRAFWIALSTACRARDGWRCRKCKAEHDSIPGLRLDAAHVVPLRMGGSREDATDPRNTLPNLVTLCRGPEPSRGCHADKDVRHAWPWSSIGVVPDPELVRKYGYREAVAA
jgi:hypothetical protein